MAIGRHPVRGAKPGIVFAPALFVRLGGRAAVRRALAFAQTAARMRHIVARLPALPRSPSNNARGSPFVSPFCRGSHCLAWSYGIRQGRVLVTFRLCYLSEKRAIFRT